MSRAGVGTPAIAAWPAMAVGVAVLCAVLAGPPAAHARLKNGPASQPESMRRALQHHVFRTLDGESLTLASLHGQVVVLNFWASWCTPCRKELPALDALQAAIAGQGGRVVAVSIDCDRQNVAHFVRTHSLKLSIVPEGPDGLASELNLQNIPFTVVLDRDGAVAFTSTGANDRAVGEIGAITRQLLARTPVVARTAEGGTR
jgi:thiol-disulfide isomerase/thioredoxin